MLKTPKNFLPVNLKALIETLDQENLLSFFTENFEIPTFNNKNPAYFLNSLDIKIITSNNILNEINKKFSFIRNENIKEYFLNMYCIAYSNLDKHFELDGEIIPRNETIFGINEEEIGNEFIFMLDRMVGREFIRTTEASIDISTLTMNEEDTYNFLEKDECFKSPTNYNCPSKKSKYFDYE